MVILLPAPENTAANGVPRRLGNDELGYPADHPGMDCNRLLRASIQSWSPNMRMSGPAAPGSALMTEPAASVFPMRMQCLARSSLSRLRETFHPNRVVIPLRLEDVAIGVTGAVSITVEGASYSRA